MDIFNVYQTNKKHYIELNKISQNGGAYSEIFVFNRLNNIIHKIPYAEYDRTIHNTVDDKELEELTIANDLNIKKVIEMHPKYKSRFFHVSLNMLNGIYDTSNDHQSWAGSGFYYNPKGIWVSCGTSWQKYVGNKPRVWSLATYIYEIFPSETVLRIHSLNEFKEFISKYKKKNIRKIYDIINWKEVKKVYDGMIICPYLGDKIWGKSASTIGIWGDKKNIDKYIVNMVGNEWKNDIKYTAEWYRHWEEGSGVIWRNKGLISIRLVTKLDTFDHIGRK